MRISSIPYTRVYRIQARDPIYRKVHNSCSRSNLLLLIFDFSWAGGAAIPPSRLQFYWPESIQLSSSQPGSCIFKEIIVFCVSESNFFRRRFAPPSEMNTIGRHWDELQSRLQFYCQILLAAAGNPGFALTTNFFLPSYKILCSLS